MYACELGGLSAGERLRIVAPFESIEFTEKLLAQCGAAHQRGVLLKLSAPRLDATAQVTERNHRPSRERLVKYSSSELASTYHRPRSSIPPARSPDNSRLRAFSRLIRSRTAANASGTSLSSLISVVIACMVPPGLYI